MGMAGLIVVAVAGHAVVIVPVRVGHAEIAIVADPGCAGRGAAGLRPAALDAWRIEAPGAVVIGLAHGAFQPQREIRRGLRRHTGGQRTRARGRAAAHSGTARDAARGHGGRDLVVEQVHDAADGAAAIEQRRRSAQHLDAFDQQRLGRDRVVRRDVRGVEQAGTVGEDGHAGRGLAADHRTRRAAAEGVGMHTGQAAERFAQRGARALEQRLTLEHRERRGDLLRILVDGGGVDIHRLEFGLIGLPGGCE